MKSILSKSASGFLFQYFFIWSFLNIFFNILGLFINKIAAGVDFIFLNNIYLEFVLPILVQNIAFLFCILFGILFISKTKWIPYLFPGLQFLVFHIIFFSNLHFKNGLHFVAKFDGFSVKYLGYFGQHLVDTITLSISLNGSFNSGVFAPDNLGAFYFCFIFLILLYYILLTTFSALTVNFFSPIKYDKDANKESEIKNLS